MRRRQRAVEGRRSPPPAVGAWLGALERGSRRPSGSVAPAAAVGAAEAAPAAAPPPPAAAAASPLPPHPLLTAEQQWREQRQRPAPALVHQRLSVRRSRFSPPRELHPQASQLIGLLFTFLGPPAFKPAVPGVRHPNTEGKYDLLRLLWRRGERRRARAAAAAAGAAAGAETGPLGGGAAAAGDGSSVGLGSPEEVALDEASEERLVAALTIHLRISLDKVLADPMVPERAREVALRRLREREASVARGLQSWLDAAMARPDFEPAILPLLRAVLGPIEAAGGFEPAVDGRGGPLSAANGAAMEARVQRLVAEQLPPGWSLLAGAHIVALDGRHPGHHAACKWEADCVALDETGTVVALFEAKQANANPLMTLLTDVDRCIALVDTLTGCSSVTLRMFEGWDGGGGGGGGSGGAHDGSEAAAAASGVSAGVEEDEAGSGGSGSGSVEDGGGDADDEGEGEEGPGPVAALATGAPAAAGGGEAASPDRRAVKEQRRLRKAAAAASRQRKLWRDVTVPVHPDLQPVYVIGRPLRRKDLVRGLASAASAEALKLASRDADALAAALGVAGGAGGCGCGGVTQGSGGGADGGTATVLAPPAPPALTAAALAALRGGGTSSSGGGAEPLPPAGSVGSELSDVSLGSVLSGGASDYSVGSGIGLGGPGGGGALGEGDDDAPRLVMRLPQEWREAIAETVMGRLELLAGRCTVLAIDDLETRGGGGGSGESPGAA